VLIARRVYLYAIAFVAVGVLLTGLAGLLQVALQALVEVLGPPIAAVGRRDLRGDVSFSGALTATGLLVWLIHWWLADRAVRRESPAAAFPGDRHPEPTEGSAARADAWVGGGAHRM
jgi:hypothetical protein